MQEAIAPVWIKVADCAEFEDTDLLGVVTAGGTSLCLYRLDDGYYATADRCSHGEARLSDGLVLGCKYIECPLHEGTFDIRTGNAAAAPCTLPIRTFEVRVEEGAIYVRF